LVLFFKKEHSSLTDSLPIAALCFMLRAVAIALCLLPGTALAAPLPLLGDYLDIAYIRVLQKTHSPLAAAAGDSRLHLPQLISVQAQGSARRFAANFNWRGGVLLFVLQRNGAIHREMAWGPDPAVALRITGPDAFCLAPPDGAEHCYHYVRDAERYIGRVALAGRYVDRQGAAYSFAADGHAHFPGYDFEYALVLEQVADKYDFFAIGTQGRFMAFRRVGEMMTLYPVGPGKDPAYGAPDFAHPLAVLRTQGGAKVLASK
jgi:hypothetical protein